MLIIGLLSKSYVELKAVNFSHFQQECLYCLTFAAYVYSIYWPLMQPSDDKEHLALTLYQNCIEFSYLTVVNASNLADTNMDIIVVLRKVIASSIELNNRVNNVDMKQKLSKEINKIGLVLTEKAAQNEKLLEFAITLFTWSLNNLENALKQIKVDISYNKDVAMATTMENELRVLKGNTELFIAYVYMELRHLERALACVERTIQESRDLQNNLLSSGMEYLRLTINCKNKSTFAAEESVKKLIHTTSEYAMAIKGILQFITIGDDVVSDQLFTVVAQKFPHDPEYVQTRILRLKFLLTCNYTLNRPSTDQALQLCSSIIDDHLMHVHTLTGEQQNDVFSVIMEKIQWTHKQRRFQEVCDWCKIGLCIHGDAAILQSNHTSIHLYMSTSYEELNMYDDMLQHAEKATAVCHSNKTMQHLFKSLLLVRSANEAVQAVVNFQLDTLNINKVEVLDRYILCVKEVLVLANKLTHAKRYHAIELLLQEWIQYCTANSLWGRTDNTFFMINAALLQHIYNYKVNLTILQHKQDDLMDTHEEPQHIELYFAPPPPDYLDVNNFTASPFTEKDLERILSIFSNILAVIDGFKKQGMQLELLGSTLELGLFADICWNMANLHCWHRNEDSVVLQQVVTEYSDNYDIELFEFAGRFYSMLNSAEDKINQACALLKSNKHCISDLNSAKRAGNATVATDDTRYDKVFLNFAKIEKLLQELKAEDTIDKREMIARLTSSYIVSHFFATYLRGTPKSMWEYVTGEKRHLLLSLDAEELSECINLVRDVTNSYYEVIKVLTNYAIQACTRDAAHDQSLLGRLYIDRIRLSESREAALSAIVEIDQQLSRTESNLFNYDDIDSIVSMTYNNGVSLAELNNYAMAEEFLRMSVSIAAHSSEHMKTTNMQQIQSTYDRITSLRSKLEDTNRNEHTHFSTTTSVSVIAESKPLSIEFF